MARNNSGNPAVWIVKEDVSFYVSQFIFWIPLFTILLWWEGMHAFDFLSWNTALIFPSSYSMIQEVWYLFVGDKYYDPGDPLIYQHVGMSAIRVFPGLIVGSIAGFILGPILAVFPVGRSIAKKILPISFASSKISVFLIFMIWFGLYWEPKILISGWVSFLFLCTPTFYNSLLVLYGGEKISGVELIERAVDGNYSRKDLLRYILFPKLFPQFFLGIELAASSCWTLLVFTESFSTNTGMGYLVFRSHEHGDYALLYVSTFLLACCNWVTWIMIRRIRSFFF